MNRFSSSLALSIGATAGASDVLFFGEFTMGFVHVPAGSGLNTIAWYTCATEDGTYLPAYDEDNAAISQTVDAEKAFAIPVSLAGAVYVKPVGNEAQAVTVVLKA